MCKESDIKKKVLGIVSISDVVIVRLGEDDPFSNTLGNVLEAKVDPICPSFPPINRVSFAAHLRGFPRTLSALRLLAYFCVQ
jgi:hypothetical protein